MLLVDAFLGNAVSAISEVIEGFVTIAASTFAEFALSYVLDVMYDTFEMTFMETGIELAMNTLSGFRARVEQLFYMLRKQTIASQLLRGSDEEEETQMEDVMETICTFGTKCVGAFVLTPTLYFCWDFNAQLGFTGLWSTSRSSLLLFTLFCAVVFPFVWLQRAFGFNSQELFLGWRVHEYLKYARYRFANRTARWKGLELHVDESIEPALRSTDQLCFSSQWYFVLTLTAGGGVMFLLAICMLIQIQSYDPFSDVVVLPTLIAFIVALCAFGRRVLVGIAGAARLWSLRARTFDGSMADDRDIPDLMSGAPARRPMQRPNDQAPAGPAGPRAPLTSADLQSEAFREAFFAENKLWLLQHLSRTGYVPAGFAGAYRGPQLSSDDELSDEEARHGAHWRHASLALSPKTVHLLRHWAAAAILRAPGRLGRPARQLLTSDSSDEEAGRPSTWFPPSHPPAHVTSSILRGWLAAARSSAKRQVRADLSSATEATDSMASEEGEIPLDGDVVPDARFVLMGW